MLEQRHMQLNQLIIDLLENERESFPQGWPGIGIPPLDPYYIEKLEPDVTTIGTLTSYVSLVYCILS